MSAWCSLSVRGSQRRVLAKRIFGSSSIMRLTCCGIIVACGLTVVSGGTLAEAGRSADTSPFLFAYPAPAANLTTDTFSVSISQGVGPAQDGAVLHSNSSTRCPTSWFGCKPGQSVSWTSFAFSGAPVTVTVSRRSDWAGPLTLRPASYNLTANRVNATAWSFTLPPTATGWKVSVESPVQILNHTRDDTWSGVLDALMIFADPPEDPSLVPKAGSPSVMYFGPGVHNLDGQIPVPATVTDVYVAPGAWVNGGFISEGCPKCQWTGSPSSPGQCMNCRKGTVRITGRGVISGHNFPFLKDPAGQFSDCHYNPANHSFCWALINLDQGQGHLVDGVTLVDPPKYYFRSYAPDIHVRNVKLVSSWTENTDGFVSGDRGLLEDSFIRSNDDSIKLFANDMTVRNCVIWQQEGGAVFQMGWWTTHVVSGAVVEDVDVIHTEWLHNHVTETGNSGVFNLLACPIKDYYVHNMSWNRIRVEGTPARLIMIEMEEPEYEKPPLTDNSTLTAWHFRDVEVEGFPLNSDIISAAGIVVTDFEFVNLQLNGSCATDVQSAGILFAKDNNPSKGSPQPANSKFTFTCPGRG